MADVVPGHPSGGSGSVEGGAGERDRGREGRASQEIRQ